MTKNEKAAQELLARITPYQIYTEKRGVIAEVLVQLPGGFLMYDGGRWEPVVTNIGAGVCTLRFKERE